MSWQRSDWVGPALTKEATTPIKSKRQSIIRVFTIADIRNFIFIILPANDFQHSLLPEFIVRFASSSVKISIANLDS